MRIACVFVPQLALQAVLRRTPEARGGPVAVLEANGGGTGGGAGTSGGASKARAKRVARVTQFSPEARREGVRAGMTGAQAGRGLGGAAPADGHRRRSRGGIRRAGRRRLRVRAAHRA